MERVLGIDATTSGAAGDMLIAALIALQPKREHVERDIKSILSNVMGKDVHFEFQEVRKNGFAGNQLKRLVPTEQLPVEAISEIFTKLEKHMGDLGKSIMEDAWKSIQEAEKKVHRVDQIHLHELGAFDTVFDIFTASYLVDKLNPKFLVLSPVNTGSGAVKTKHGILPVPSPATQVILQSKRIQTLSKGKGELLTPTGAAIIGAIATSLEPAEKVVWIDSALGFGEKNIEGRLNAVRVRLGEVKETTSEIVVLETNVDDISGEILGDAVSELLDRGALDVSYIPIFTKKNRPGWQIQVITSKDLSEELAKGLMRLTGTLGVRIREINRHIGKREIKTTKIKVENKVFEVRIKKGPYSKKIEFEDLKRVARELQKTPLEILNLMKTIDE